VKGLPPHLRRIMERQGVDLIALAELSDAPVLNPRGWINEDPDGWLRDTVNSQLAGAVPAGYRSAELTDLEDEHEETERQLLGWISDHLDQPQRYPWLLFGGLPGRGKTHLGWATLMYIVRWHAVHRRRVTWQRTDQHSLNDEVRVKPDQSHAYALKKYLTTDLLFFDDVGAGRPTDFNGEATLRIIDHRYEHRLATIYGSNLGKSALIELLGERVYSRLAEAARIVVKGEDRREHQGWKP
jgi:DNA replication protein DnaC